uniref:NADH dehydrogenase subunit 4L n=1 Tax=Ruditapes decussatus TaxID=104385 RepID=A0A219LUW0_9BIVA|nr:NADH dehydrogenase subunit 4L [Ruditapes decussatus]AJY78591.1 NADH dehydrogenase subunit 4L [Ruditapes decussatus]
MGVCFFSILCVAWQDKFFLNILLLFEFFMLSLLVLCMYAGMLKMSAMVAYLCIMVLCLDVSGSVMGLALLVNSSRKASKKKVHAFSFLVF